jgi:hypothetical protein
MQGIQRVETKREVTSGIGDENEMFRAGLETKLDVSGVIGDETRGFSRDCR